MRSRCHSIDHQPAQDWPSHRGPTGAWSRPTLFLYDWAKSPSATMKPESGPTWFRHIPAARWLADYRVEWLASDAIAGATLAAYAIPVSLAYAGLAGLPPQAGIYGYLLGGLGYALLGSSRQLAIGPTSAISLMIAGTVATMADGDAQRYAQIASLAAGMVALLCLIAWLLRLSMLVRLISDSILVGFKAGAGLTIAMTQMPSLLGVAGGGRNFFERTALLAGQLGQINYLVFALGVLAILLLVLGERAFPARPSPFPISGCPPPERCRRVCHPSSSPGCACTTSRGSFRWLPDVCCSPTSKVFPRRARSRRSMAIASIRGRNSSELARPTSRQHWAMAIPWRVACRNPQSTTRRGRRPRTARVDFCLLYAGAVPPLSHGPTGKSAEGGACRHRADRSVRTDRFSGDASHVAHQPDRFLRGGDRAWRRAASRDPARNIARRVGLRPDAVDARVQPSRRVPGSHSRNDELFRSRPPSRE